MKKIYYKKNKRKNKDEHILIMENYLGRPLEKGEIVHHVDNIKKHNFIDNLELCLKNIHAKYHYENGDLFNIGKWRHKNSPGRKHGTYSCWYAGCRCEPCIFAQREYKKQYRKRTGIH